MDIFDILNLLWGLSLFLFGMNIMGIYLEKRAGNGLKKLLGKLTDNKFAAFFTGLAVTAVIQSSSATTVMAVGFVNSSLMSLRQAINVIMGANVGTTITAWLLSLSGISGKSIFVSLFKPTSFTPIIALIGIVFLIFGKSNQKKDTAAVLLGFATLILGMNTMSQAVSGLKDVPAFSKAFIMFKNPILGVIAGAVLTAIIQSSSASVGILQALAITGQVSYGAAIPIIMGQNIGTCITALISSVGTGKNARRTAYAHMIFNILGTVIWLSVFVILSYTLKNAFFDKSASLFGIAAAHSIFNILCTIVLFPMSSVIEKMTIFIFPDKEDASKNSELDERLLVTPPIALQKCHDLVCQMSKKAMEACNLSVDLLFNYDKEKADIVINTEEFADHYEDIIGSYLVKLSTHNISDEDNATVTKLLKLISDFERICDHSINVLEAATELHDKGIILSDNSKKELSVLCSAVKEILSHSHMAFINNDYKLASHIEPLEQVIDNLKDEMRNTHIARLKINESTIEESFIWSDILTNLERISDHCSNIALSVLETSKGSLKPHEYLSNIKNDTQNDFSEQYKYYLSKYTI